MGPAEERLVRRAQIYLQTEMTKIKHGVQLGTSMPAIVFVTVTPVGGFMKSKTSYRALYDQLLRDRFGVGYRRNSSVQGYLSEGLL